MSESGETTAPYGEGPKAAGQGKPIRRIRTHHLLEMKQRGEKWAMLTAYEQYAAQTFDEAGIPVLLVGDSASNNVYGNETSIPVTVDELLPLVRAVTRSVRRALVVADLPFGSYQASPEQAFHTSVRFMKESGAHAVKLEGGTAMAPQVDLLTTSGDPGDGAHRLHAAVRARARRLPRAGPRRHRVPAARGRARARGGRGVRRRHGDGARRRGGEGHRDPDDPDHRHRRRTATATPRCWSGRTWPGCAPAGWRSSSSSTPTCTACCSRPRRTTPPTWRPATFPGPEHTF